MKSIYLFTTLLGCLVSQLAFSQEAIYLKVTATPPITGPVTVTGFANQIQLTSAQFGENVQISITGQPGRPSLTPITITKTVDASSTKLMQGLVNGRTFEAIEINFVRGTAPANVYYKIELTDVHMSNHSISLVPNCPNGCSGLAESFALDYRTIKVTTYTQLSTGQIVADTPSYTYSKP